VSSRSEGLELSTSLVYPLLGFSTPELIFLYTKNPATAIKMIARIMKNQNSQLVPFGVLSYPGTFYFIRSLILLDAS
jgi:hypothetical protein